MKNKWLKKGMLVLAVGCLTFSAAGCKGEQVIEKVLEKTDTKKEENEADKEKQTKPKVNVEKPEWTVNLSGSVVYKTGSSAKPLKVDAMTTDGGEITYQWYRSLTNTNGGGTVIEGATESTFIPPTEEQGTVYYYAVAISTIENSTNRITSDTIEVVVSDSGEKEAEEGEEAEQKEDKAEEKTEEASEEKPAEGEKAEGEPAEQSEKEAQQTEEKPAEGQNAQ